MKLKLTLNVFAVIVLTIEAFVIKMNRFEQWTGFHEQNRIRKMATQLSHEIMDNDEIRPYGYLSHSIVEELEEAILRTFEQYRVKISKKGGLTVSETSELTPLMIGESSIRVQGTVIRTSEEFPNVTTDVVRKQIATQIELRRLPQSNSDDPDRFAEIEEVIKDAISRWADEFPADCEVSEVTSTEFYDQSIKTVTLKLNPNEALVVKDFSLDKLTDSQQEKRSLAIESGVRVIHGFTITEQGGSTVIERFHLDNLDFTKTVVAINDITVDLTTLGKITDVHLSLGFPSVKFNVYCHTLTKHSESIDGHYDILDIGVTFEKLIIDVKSSWRDDGSKRSLIEQAEIINFYFEGSMDIAVEFDPRMEPIVKDMLSSFDGLVRQLFVDIEKDVKQSSQANEILMKFLQDMFYGDVRDEIGNDDHSWVRAG